MTSSGEYIQPVSERLAAAGVIGPVAVGGRLDTFLVRPDASPATLRAAESAMHSLYEELGPTRVLTTTGHTLMRHNVVNAVPYYDPNVPLGDQPRYQERGVFYKWFPADVLEAIGGKNG